MTNQEKQTFTNAAVMQSTVNVETQEKPQCGCCGVYPVSFQKFSNPKTFLVLFSLKNVIQGMLWTYMVGISTSTERHFQFNSKKIGLLITLGEIGQINTAVFMAFYGSRGNRPRWMATGLYTIALSCLLFSSLSLVFPPPFNYGIKNTTTTGERMCRVKGYEAVTPRVNGLYQPGGFSAGNQSVKNVEYSLVNPAGVPTDGAARNGSVRIVQHEDGVEVSHHWTTPPWEEVVEVEDTCTIDAATNNFAWGACFVIYTLMGIGATTVYTIGAPYLDDSVSKKDSPLYFAISIAMRIFGPVFGYLLSSAVLKIYVYPTTDPGFSKDDPRWIGAWWLGLLILTGLLNIAAIIMALFPRRMSPSDQKVEVILLQQEKEVEKVQDNENRKHKVVLQLSELKDALCRLLKNVILMCSCSSNVFSIFGLAGFFIYLPKYYEHQFRFNKSDSSLYAGLSGSAPMIFGVLTGGLLMKKYRPRARTVALVIAGCKYVYVAGLLVLMFLDCNWDDIPGTFREDGSLDLTDDCNSGCGCGQEEFIPVCFETVTTRHTFFSPCHAGCTEKPLNASHTELYSSCRCLPDMALTVKPGYCNSSCSLTYVYVIVLALVKFIVSTSTIGNLIIDLRCVEPQDKAIALGFLTAMTSLFGFLPMPVIFGALIDSTCLIWEESCNTSGACWVYDTTSFRYKLHGLTAASLFLAGMFEIVIYFKAGNLQLADEEVEGGKDEKQNKSMIESRL